MLNVLDRLRGRSPREGGEPGSGQAGPADEGQLPIPGYDRLDDKEVGGRLPDLSQAELAAVETYERSHRERPVVLDKLRYMRTTEPLPDYDALSPEQIASALTDADTATIKAVRDYERKFGHRKQVLDQAARVLPTAKASAGEDRAREAKSARVREGFASRRRTGGDLTDRRAGP
jgi:hypothetical protein